MQALRNEQISNNRLYIVPFQGKMTTNNAQERGLRVPMVAGHINNMPVECLIDTGAVRTVIKLRAWQRVKLPHNRVRKDPKLSLQAANGHNICILGETDVELKLHRQRGNPSRTPMIIVDRVHFPGDLIIGMDTLSRSKTTLDFESNILQIDGIKIKLYNRSVPSLNALLSFQGLTTTFEGKRTENVQSPQVDESHRIINTHAFTDERVGPNEMKFTFSHANIPDGTYLVHKNSADNNPNILIAEALVTVKKGRIPILLLNPTDASAVFNMNSCVSKVTPINVDSIKISSLGGTLASELGGNPGDLEEAMQINTINNMKVKPVSDTAIDTSLQGQEKSQLTNLVNRYRDVIAIKGESLGQTSHGEHEIRLQPNAPVVYRRQYPLPHSQLDEVDRLVSEMQDKGVIEESNSCWNSPLILVKKKDGSMRPCVDFRELNKHTIPDRYPIPRIPEILQNLSGSNFYSSLDLESAFWQIPLRKGDRHKAAFTTRQGHWQFKVMPFGLQGSPSTFVRCISSVLAELVGKAVFVYLDDIVIHTKTKEEHFKMIENVFERLRISGLKVKLAKCEFFKTKLKYLGH